MLPSIKRRLQRISCYRATGQALCLGTRPTFQVFTQDAGELVGQEAPRSGPRLLPQTPYYSCECIFGAVSTSWRFVGMRSFKKRQQKKTVALNGRGLRRVAVRSPGVAFFLFFSTPGFIIVFLQYHTVSSHMTSKGKGTQTQIGPIFL